MALLEWFESIRTPVLTGFFSAMTFLGEDIVLFAALGFILYWCYEKRIGLYVMSTALLSTLVGQFLKIVCRVPRPWIQKPEFTVVESARAGAGGYSFPSGHSSAAASFFGAVAAIVKKRWVTVLCVVVTLLVMISRMYLGVHFPSDVLVGGLLGLGAVLVLRPLMIGRRATDKRTLSALVAMALIAGAAVIYVSAAKFPADVDADNLREAVKNAWSLLGATVGACLGWLLELRCVRFTEKAPLPAQVVKVVLGLGVTIGILYGLKGPFNALFGGNLAANALRYGLATFFATGVWPMTFTRLNRIGAKKG